MLHILGAVQTWAEHAIHKTMLQNIPESGQGPNVTAHGIFYENPGLKFRGTVRRQFSRAVGKEVRLLSKVGGGGYPFRMCFGYDPRPCALVARPAEGRAGRFEDDGQLVPLRMQVSKRAFQLALRLQLRQVSACRDAVNALQDFHPMCFDISR